MIFEEEISIFVFSFISRVLAGKINCQPNGLKADFFHPSSPFRILAGSFVKVVLARFAKPLPKVYVC